MSAARKPAASAPSASAPSASGRACPICGKPEVQAYRPFCSKRCADVDLNRWLTGAYAISVAAEEDEDGETPAGERGE